MICGILKNRSRINPQLPDKMVKEAMKHPLSLVDILRFKQYKFQNLAFYAIGKMPARCSVMVITILGKRKHVI
jgi:hypothetical protein